MGKLEKITANMELTESKKFKFQKAILAMMLEWKHLEEYMDSTQHSFQECLDELQLKEKYLNSVQESAVESNKEMESVRVSIEGRIKELDDRKREFQVFRDELVNELDFKKKQLGLIGKSIEERIKLVEFREEKLAVEEKRFEDIRKSVGERIQDINSKGMLLEKRSKELDAKEEDIERRYKELESKDIEKGFKELESKDKELGDRVRKIESMVKQISNEDIQMSGVGGDRGRCLGKRPFADLDAYSGILRGRIPAARASQRQSQPPVVSTAQQSPVRMSPQQTPETFALPSVSPRIHGRGKDFMFGFLTRAYEKEKAEKAKARRQMNCETPVSQHV